MSYIEASLAKLRVFEGCIHWMYQDTVGKVTVGVGCMLPDAASACALQFIKDGRWATAEEITAEFHQVSALPPGKPPAAYKGVITLPDAAIDAELRKRLMVADAALRHDFPNYDSLPDSWKLGLLDLDYNMGPHSLPVKFPHFTQAVRSGNGQAAEAQCIRPQVGLRRNAWTQNCFAA